MFWLFFFFLMGKFSELPFLLLLEMYPEDKRREDHGSLK